MLALVAPAEVLPAWGIAGQRRRRQVAQAVKHQRQRPVAEFGGARFARPADDLQLLEQLGYVANPDVRPQDARLLSARDDLAGQLVRSPAFAPQLVGRREGSGQARRE